MSDIHSLKIIIIGQRRTGKTSFLRRWAKDTFDEKYESSIGYDFGLKEININEKPYYIQLWDSIVIGTNLFLQEYMKKGTLGCIIMTDATKVNTREK